MKKRISIIIALSMLLSLLPMVAYGADEKDFISEDFEAAEALSKWSVTGNGEENMSIGIAPHPDGGKMLKIADTGNPKSVIASKSFDAKKETVAFEMDIMADKTSTSSTAFYFYSTDNKNTIVVTFTASAVSAFNGATLASNIGKLKAGTFARLRIEIFVPENKFNVYLGTELIANQFAFRTEATDIARMAIMSPTTSTNPVLGYVDNIRGYIPEKIVVDGKELKPTTPQMLPSNSFKITSIKDGILLKPSCEVAYVGGEKKIIDPNNKLVAPFIDNDRTYVPIRFIAESLGATVGFDEATEMANITLGSSKIALKPNSKEIIVNGEPKTSDVPSKLVENRIFVPLRIIAESFGKKVGYDPVGVVTITNEKEFTREELFYIAAQIGSEGEKTSPDKYSALYLSSRWYRIDGRDGQMGTIDAIKRFNPTAIKWAYITQPNEVKAIQALGVEHQGTISSTLPDVPNQSPKVYEVGRAKTFEGKSFKPFHMTWEISVGCFNHPDYLDILWNDVKAIIDSGTYSIQVDDWLSNSSYYELNGCFCDYCMKDFTAYIKNNYTKEQIAAFGIENIDTFHYKTFLTEKFGAKTLSEYNAIKGKTPLDGIFKKFQETITAGFFHDIRKKADEYAGRHVIFSCNAGHFIGNYNDPQHKYGFDFFDISIGESDEYEYETIDNMIVSTGLFESLNKPFIVSPRTTSAVQLDVDVSRRGAAATYATGGYFLVPWDVWIFGQPLRYFGSPAEYNDLFHFVRQYPELFDKHERAADVAILADWSALREKDTKEAFTKASLRLFKNGVAYRVLPINAAEPEIHLDAADLSGIQSIITVHSLDKLAPQDKALIEGCGIKIINASAIDDGFIEKYQSIKISEDSAVFGLSRETVLGEKTVHILNDKPGIATNIGVKLSGLGNDKVSLYRPGETPLVLTAQNDTVVIPSMREWAILRVGAQSSAWSQYNIGMPAYSSSVEATDNEIMISANAPGFNYKTSDLDTGTGDYVGFAYQSLNQMDFDFSAKIDHSALSEKATDGIMVRNGISANAIFAAIGYDKQAGYRFMYRENDNEGIKIIPISGNGEYVRLVKSGESIKAYVGSDANSLKDVAGAKLVFGARLVGGFVCANGDKVESAKISEITVKEIPSTAKITSLGFTAQYEAIPIGEKNRTFLSVSLDNREKPTLSNMKVEYTSSDPNIISIDNRGTALGVGEGEVTITAKVTFGIAVKEKTLKMKSAKKILLLEERFDGQEIGKVPAGWAQYHQTKEATITVEKVPQRDSLGLKLTDTVPKPLNAKKTFTSQGGIVTVEFDYFKEKQEIKTGTLLTYIYEGMTPTMMLSIANQNFVWIAGSETVLAPFEDGKWYKIQVVCNTPNQTADVIIDGKTVGTNLPYIVPVKQLNQVMLAATSAGDPEMNYFDNILVYTGKPNE